MTTELLVSNNAGGSRIALLQNKRLVEFHQDHGEGQFNVGDIYLGQIKKLSPAMNAAFVDVGYEKDAFLHYHDLGPKFRSLNKLVKNGMHGKALNGKLSNFKIEPDIDKHGKITQVLNKGNLVMVQVDKEPISTKGPRLTCEISLAGRYLVLVPFSNVLNVSKRISTKEERNRLIRLVSSIRPEGFGVIVRTVAEGKEVAELHKDLNNLMEMWEEGFQRMKKTPKPGTKILGELGKTSSMLRDILNEDFESITVDSQEEAQNIKSFIKGIDPGREKIVRLHNGRQKLFETAGVERQIKALFGKTVSLPSGGYLVIEHTEALHVIDVNSGNSSSRMNGRKKESTALEVNQEAAREIARQLRLRDMGGIIVVDFIDMRSAEDRRKLFEEMKAAMNMDKSRSTVLPLSKFGLMQITRQRYRPEVNISTREVCPTCNGEGKIDASILVTDQIESELKFLMEQQNQKKVTLVVHPFLHAYYTKGLLSRRVKWFFQYKRWVVMEPDTSLGIVEFRFLNEEGEPIEVKKDEKVKDEKVKEEEVQ